ncbi:unnamed protein product [Rotaria magnacalcarata]|uniref:Vesicle-fusing ATPase n=9 Tax=Rotaria magnacalcarata TaxID=392030 RepID=A0A819RF54_9BILA|nr:unnamed protein product [Rotaria magnacalcarata]CAF1908238.1 unnamed protein product [Rotaria magnacalcarata]CAF2054203.1 unnamed protein product [Rotaria magnacalcarata]CAF2058263.1 unnamed protein product [Rotaria magnacalcarata]CAF3840447.1 unnamed protein product [Rotaria magnacalcarata]
MSSASMQLVAAKCPTDELSFTNSAVINEKDIDPKHVRHIELSSSITNTKFIFTIIKYGSMSQGKIGFNTLQRRWAGIELDRPYQIRPYVFDKNIQSIATLILEVDFLNKKNTTADPYDSDKMAIEFLQQYIDHAFSVGQCLPFQFLDKKTLIIAVKEIESVDLAAVARGQNSKARKIPLGVSLANTMVIFERAEGSSINLAGKSKGKSQFVSIINPDFDFKTMGIGGLDTEFNAIFRRAFASRVFPPEVVYQLGMKHCRGILLYGPPGTGKTLMARQIGKMLNAREPKIVNGPQILDKYVGESEANIRKLFADADEEEKRLGPNSGLHIIIFDEIDAICKSRGSVASGAGVHDTVVNQLLSKIDGVDQLNNILIIGMTNRRDMIDEALLRPGRLEVQIEIGLPDENGRSQILNIHTARLREHNKLNADVDLKEFSEITRNFSGAELEGLVRAAMSFAMNRHIKAGKRVEIDPEAADKLQVCRADFMHAFENDIKPAFGISKEEFDSYISNGIIIWGQSVTDVLEEGELRIRQTIKSEMTPLVSILIEGPPNSGKTALAAHIALLSKFPYLKFCTAQTMLGFSELAKCQQLKKIFEDAHKSTLSCVVVDELETLLEYAPVGPRYSNNVLQTLKLLFKRAPPKGRKLFIIATTAYRDILDQLGLLASFSKVIHIANMSSGQHILHVLNEMEHCFNNDEMRYLEKKLHDKKVCIGIKALLDLIEVARQAEDKSRVGRFISQLEEVAGMI